MKRTYLIALSFIILLVIQTGSLRLQSHIAQPATGGLSGDPGEDNCRHCHSDLPADTSASRFVIRMAADSASLASPASIINPASQYTPGATHWMSIQLNGRNGNTPKYGFQLTSLHNNDSMAGSFTVTNPANTTTETLPSTPSGNRTYISHHFANTNNVWTFKWTAPMSGNVTFYYAGNLGNGHNDDRLDSICLGKATVSMAPLGIDDRLNNLSSVSCFPMPLGQCMTTTLDLTKSGPLSISLLNQEGQTVKELYYTAATQGHFEKTFDISDVAAGMYLLYVRSDASAKTLKIVKY